MRQAELPDYTLRRSSRAKHVSLRVTRTEGLIVVVPLRFDSDGVPELLDAKRGWIDRKLSALEKIDRDIGPPDIIELDAVRTTWRVVYRPTASTRVFARTADGNRLVVTGDVSNHADCRAAIKRWLARQGGNELVPWLEKLSVVHDLPFRKVSVRGQKTRWGSCSSRKTISINYQLLFLEPSLVNCVLIHELCHTRHLNHGADFWQLVGQLQPDYAHLHQRLKLAWAGLPGWLAAI